MYHTSIKRELIELSYDISNIDKYKCISLKINREIKKRFFFLHYFGHQ